MSPQLGRYFMPRSEAHEVDSNLSSMRIIRVLSWCLSAAWPARPWPRYDPDSINEALAACTKRVVDRGVSVEPT